jgi:hypothetical protein
MTISLVTYLENMDSPSVIRENILIEGVVDNLYNFYCNARDKQGVKIDMPAFNSLVNASKKMSPEKREIIRKELAITFWEKLSQVSGAVGVFGSILTAVLSALGQNGDRSIWMGLSAAVCVLTLIAFVLWLSSYSIAKIQGRIFGYKAVNAYGLGGDTRKKEKRY